MGMYNEVFTSCPNCGGLGEGQITPIILGFGGFNLDNPDSLAEKLNEEELVRLAEYTKDCSFTCEKCDSSFRLNQREERERRVALAHRLFGL